MFCKTCLDCLQQLKGLILREEGGLFFVHHLSAFALRAAADQGCRFCYAFWDGITPNGRAVLLSLDGQVPGSVEDLPDPDIDSEDASAVRWKYMQQCATFARIEPAEGLLGDHFQGDVVFCVLLGSERKIPKPEQSQEMSIFLLQDVSDSSTEEPTRFRPVVSTNTRSDETWYLAKEWIDTCVKSHKSCNEVKDSNWCPTRLLELYGGEDSVRLVEHATHTDEQYMTLSHRWSSIQPLSLTRLNLDQLRRGISVLELPQAYQDAIAICVRLRIRYIWIDSLCIMQDKDSRSDWIKEAALMEKVYSNSFMNISALAAVDSNHSFFVDRNLRHLEEEKISTTLNNLRLGTHVREYQVTDMFFWQNGLSKNHLNLRGWVLQERLLSPRVLHFGPSQIFWECREQDAAECFPEGLPQATNTLIATRFKNLNPDRYQSRMARYKRDLLPETSAYSLWSRIVGAYSECHLTKSEDKLIALSGIAKYMAKILKDEYVAGMWRRNLAAELLWSIDHRRQSDYEKSYRPAEYRAPSFSWASVNGVVSPGAVREQGLLIQVLDVDLQFVTTDVTGLVRGGSLLIQGQLHKLKMRRNPIVTDDIIYILVVNDVEARIQEGLEWERVGPVVQLDEHEDYFDPANRDDLWCLPARVSAAGDFLEVLLLQSIDIAAESYRRFGKATAINTYEVDILRNPSLETNSPGSVISENVQTIRLF